MTKPIFSIITHELMRETLTGAMAGDPVLPERPRRGRRFTRR
jgi:hypothetical protein